MFDCTCPASRGLQGRICGVNHPDCEALKGLSSASLGVVVSPTPAPPVLIPGLDQDLATVTTAATTGARL